MKPHTQLPRQTTRLDGGNSSIQSRPNHPLVDYHFRTPQEEPQLRGGGTSPEQTTSAAAPKFSDLSKGVFGIDGNQSNFVAEALVFAVVAAIAIFPIAVMVYVLSQTVY